MAVGYLVLALVLALTLNAGARWVRVAGTLIAALGLTMMTWSIILADLDGTFAAIRPDAPLIARATPVILNGQAVIAAAAILFLLWSAWMQARRPVRDPLPLRNTPAQFGAASRGFHWVIAVMVLCCVPIGLFMSILPEGFAGREDFVAAHQSLGLSVLVLAAARLAWLAASPAPDPLSRPGTFEHRLARLVHLALYAAMIAFPVSGYLIDQGKSVAFYGWKVPRPAVPALAEAALLVHAWVLPAVFYATFAAHLAAVLKRHFGMRDRQAVRRMLR
ncbi:cytochrome b [Erythrobacter sp. WG]|uniref:cytochrome b n=1 Tax=Erythrobacter sp. WG TaxID=2985510 RepID=UPI00226E809B|nr:cytochrome b/b6 domain-containing protein [Erythrobacter sp. WG]MCX9145831.1 cytochrome b/b6 domain-containing protein [Erythrobacter sp. WG]